MSKILNSSSKLIALVSLTGMLFTAVSSFGQCAIKTTMVNNVKTLTAAEYYTYNRTAESYDALSLKASIATAVGGKKTYKLSLIFTSTKNTPVQKLMLISDSVQIATPLLNDGVKYVDNKKFNSNTYHAEMTDSLKLFVNQHPIKKLAVTDNQGQVVTQLDVTDPSFLMQQITCLQTPVKRKPIAKKPHKIGS